MRVNKDSITCKNLIYPECKTTDKTHISEKSRSHFEHLKRYEKCKFNTPMHYELYSTVEAREESSFYEAS